MTDETNDKTEPNPQAALEQIQQLLQAAVDAKVKIDAELVAAEAARKRADSEALYASNAKTACEGHSTAIATLKGTADSEFGALLSNKQKSDEVSASLVTVKAAVEADQRVVADMRKQVTEAAQTLITSAESSASRLTEVIQSKDEALSASRTAKEASDAANAAATSSAECKRKAEQLTAEVSASMTGLQNSATASEVEISEILASAESEQQRLKAVWEHLEKSDEIARANETKNAKQSEDLDELKERIENLLPGATSAGLASSFNAQKKRFKEPQRQWLWIFVACLGLLVALAVPSFLGALGVDLGRDVDHTWSGTWKSLMLRLPILFPLIWLAIYAGRNYMLSLRLEEDYAYKEAISTAFEGYKREMERIAAGTDGPSPIMTLCSNVLTAVAERPGRIYEGKQEDITLLTATAGLAAKGANLSKKRVAT